MAPGGSGGAAASSGEDDKDAKHLLDSIGEKVYKEVKNGADGTAKKYIKELEACVSFATLSGGETANTTDPCQLIKEKREKLLRDRGERHPCGSAGEKRFSKESGGECDDKKIEGNKNNSEGGACAPFRRLSLCNKNFQKINNYDSSKAKHNLLVDVCLAAKFEAESLKTYRAQYDATYPGSDFSMCTMLARSFADIGDIIRGKDLYFGKRKKKNQNGKETETERDKLEENFKKYFHQHDCRLHENMKHLIASCRRRT